MILDWHTITGVLSSILLASLAVPYIYTILHGETRPSGVSLVGWATLYLITAAAQFSKGLDWSLVVPVISLCTSAITAVIAFTLERVVWTRADGMCFALASLALILWFITNEPLIAILLSILADLFVSLPAMIKTYHDPSTEPALLWLLYVLGSSLALLATREFTLYNILFPLYTALSALVIAIFALRTRP
jgi:hypothetical protein